MASKPCEGPTPPPPPMRRHIRHATDCPVDVRLSQVVAGDREYLRNISRGGLCFASPRPVEPGTPIHIEIPIAQPVFETDGVVAWCRETGEGFEIGVRFAGSREDPRLVSEVCQVEHYKREVWLRDGRRLTGEEAALEWLARRGGAPGGHLGTGEGEGSG